MMDKLFCVLCGKPAVTTAAHIPVCEEHWLAYALEGKQYLPDDQRPVWQSLQVASQQGRVILTGNIAMEITRLLRLTELAEKWAAQLQIEIEHQDAHLVEARELLQMLVYGNPAYRAYDNSPWLDDEMGACSLCGARLEYDDIHITGNIEHLPDCAVVRAMRWLEEHSGA